MSTETGSTSKAMFWGGVVMSALPMCMFAMGAVYSFLHPDMVAEGMTKFGYPPGIGLYLTAVQIGCAILYIIPRSSVIGAILLTGYLGGAVATHVRVGEMPTMAVIVGVFIWGGLYLRDARIRALIPITR